MRRRLNSRSASQVSTTNEGLLFVYGTLMRGQRLHRHLKSQPTIEYLGSGRIRGDLYRPHRRSYPGAVRTRAERYVHGELYRLHNPSQILRAIDKLEGLDEGLFVRRLVDVWRGSQKLKAWAYFYNKSVGNAERISSGDFLRRDIGRAG
jgi:gamma-glutamylcyclotransferase (GGCT)/AIG2-like uncharacterized protein YtfP